MTQAIGGRATKYDKTRKKNRKLSEKSPKRRVRKMEERRIESHEMEDR